MSHIIAVTLLISAIAIGISSCKRAAEVAYEFKPKNNPGWTCYASGNGPRSSVFCTPDAPGYVK